VLGLLGVFRALVGILEDDLGLAVRIITACGALLRFKVCAVFDPFLVRGVLIGAGLVGRATVGVAAHALTVPMT
jgi:hypothetical protein